VVIRLKLLTLGLWGKYLATFLPPAEQ